MASMLGNARVFLRVSFTKKNEKWEFAFTLAGSWLMTSFAHHSNCTFSGCL